MTLPVFDAGERAPRCSDSARAQGTRMLGSAGRYSAFLLVQWPLPWPRDVGDIDELAPVTALASSIGARVQLLQPAQNVQDDAGAPRAMLFAAPDPFAGYRRFELARAEPTVIDDARALLEGAGTPGEGDVLDILVCAHGSRDVCCGSLGSRLLGELPAEPTAGIRWWRTSHTGGHRFAPTAITFPDGMVWGRLDARLLQLVARRDDGVADLAGHIRGCSGLRSAGAQVVDAEAFQTYGWDWLRLPRTDRTDGDRVEIVAATPDGSRVSCSADVTEGRRVPQLPCRGPIGEVTKWDVELELADYRCGPVEPEGDGRRRGSGR